MTQKHPITPPHELVYRLQDLGNLDAIELAYQAGADQELEACCDWLIANDNPRWAVALQEGRRPKPLSLKEQAIEILDDIDTQLDAVHYNILRRALETLSD